MRCQFYRDPKIDDGLTEWHPAFLRLGKTLDQCAARYRGFCRNYKPKAKSEKRNHWGSKLLAGMKLKGKPNKKKTSPGQMNRVYPSFYFSAKNNIVIARRNDKAIAWTRS